MKHSVTLKLINDLYQESLKNAKITNRSFTQYVTDALMEKNYKIKDSESIKNDK